MFEQLLSEITTAHGPTSYTPSRGGAAVHVNVESSHRRAYSFSIINYGAYGSRNTPAPNRPGKSTYRMTIRIPGGEDISIAFSRVAHLAKERTLPNDNIRSIRDTRGDPVIQVCSRAMYLLFDIEAAQNPDQVLKRIYESVVLPINVTRDSGEMRTFSVEGLARPTVTDPANPPRTGTGTSSRRSRFSGFGGSTREQNSSQSTTFM